MQYQAEVLAQTLRLAQEKALALVQAALPRMEVEAVLLQREVQAVLRQAVALQQLAALPQALEAQELPQGFRLAMEEQYRQMQEAMVEAEAQVEVLEPGQVLVEVQLPEAPEEQR